MLKRTELEVTFSSSLCQRGYDEPRVQAPGTILSSVGSKLTERRIRIHALILAICLWSLYAFDLATPSLRDRVGQIKGTDFVHFYVLGTLANQGRGSLLYDIGAQAALIRERVPQAAALQYVPLYGPQVSIFFAPLAKLAYKDALICWWIFSA